MKAKKAHKLLEGFIGETLYREARKLYQSEVDNLIALRSHDKKPTRSIVEGALSQVKGWFRKVAGGFLGKQKMFLRTLSNGRQAILGLDIA